jgi:hypothetical protein
MVCPRYQDRSVRRKDAWRGELGVPIVILLLSVLGAELVNEKLQIPKAPSYRGIRALPAGERIPNT